MFAAADAKGKKSKLERNKKPLRYQSHPLMVLFYLGRIIFAIKESPETKLQASSYAAVIMFLSCSPRSFGRTSLFADTGDLGLQFTGP